jgi:hypothetical protein
MATLKVVYETADKLREHLFQLPNHFDFTFKGEPSPERLFGQLVSMYSRNSYVALHACLELGYVIPAGQLARALLEESIRWEWLTDDPETRAATHVGELRRNLKNIADEFAELGVSREVFLNPSPYWTTENLKPFVGGQGFPKIPKMLEDIEAHGKAAFEASGLEYGLKIHRQLYAYYRVLSQITHTSLLGMTAAMQPGDSIEDITVGMKLPVEFVALLLHVAGASVINVCTKTAEFYLEDEPSGEFISAGSLAAMGSAGSLRSRRQQFTAWRSRNLVPIKRPVLLSFGQCHNQ